MTAISYKAAFRSALLLLLAGLLSGCSFLRSPPPRPPKADVLYRRIAVIEFYDHTGYGSHGYAEALSRAVAEKLSEWTVSTDVVFVPAESLNSTDDPFVSGSMPLSALVQCRRQWRAEVAVVGALQQVRPYRQPAAHVALKVLDTAEGTLLYEQSEGWDAADSAVRAQIDDYCTIYRRETDCRFGPELFLNSPRYFLRFVADRIAFRVSRAL